MFRIGKILIQTNWDSGEPELYYLRLPKDIKDYKVIILSQLPKDINDKATLLHHNHNIMAFFEIFNLLIENC